MALSDIKHIVFLMQENRSFDHMLGFLRRVEGRLDIDGLTGTESNTLTSAGNVSVPVARLSSTRFPFSPDHRRAAVTRQIADGKMTGFVNSFHEHHPEADPQLVMGFYDEEQVAAFAQLAALFTVCNRWFASHSGPTFPNRFCAVAGRTPITDNFDVDDPQLGYVKLKTMFDFLSDANLSWRYFEHDIGFLRMFDRFRIDDEHVVPFDDERDGFEALVSTGELPQVTFIDPNFTDIPPLTEANDDLAPADVRSGQQLVARIFNALRSKRAVWRGTLFVVTYDEHGGFFDHVPPPGTPEFAKRFPDLAVMEIPPVFMPDGKNPHPQAPRSLGVRVPALVISPWVPTRSVSSLVFDHTSMIRTVFEVFGNGVVPAELGPRAQQANHLGPLLTLEEPRLDVPEIAPGSLGVPLSRPASSPSQEPDDLRLLMSRFGFPIRRQR